MGKKVGSWLGYDKDQDKMFCTVFLFFIFYYFSFLFKHIITQCLLQEFQRLIEGDYTENYKSNIWA